MSQGTFFLSFMLFCFVCLSSCGGDMDEIIIEPESVETCSNDLALMADTQIEVDFSAEAIAHLFLASCDDVSMSGESLFDYNYVIVDIEWDSWGTNDNLRFHDVLDGIPGITFGSSGIPEIGDTLSPYLGQESLFAGQNRDNRYETGGIIITIEQSGTAIGEFIGGIVEGTIDNQNDELDSAMIIGRFCAPIVSVCD